MIFYCIFYTIYYYNNFIQDLLPPVASVGFFGHEVSSPIESLISNYSLKYSFIPIFLPLTLWHRLPITIFLPFTLWQRLSITIISSYALLQPEAAAGFSFLTENLCPSPPFRN